MSRFDILNKETRKEFLEVVQRFDISGVNEFFQKKYRKNLDSFIKFDVDNSSTLMKEVTLTIIGEEFSFTIEARNTKEGKTKSIEVLCNIINRLQKAPLLQTMHDVKVIRFNVAEINKNTKKQEPFFKMDNDSYITPTQIEKRCINDHDCDKNQFDPGFISLKHSLYLTANLEKNGIHIIKCSPLFEQYLVDLIYEIHNVTVLKEKDKSILEKKGQTVIINGHPSWVSIDLLEGNRCFMIFDNTFPGAHLLKNSCTFNGECLK